MRQIPDELSFIGSTLSDDDLVSAVLNGLGAEYNPFVIAVTTASRHSPLSFSDIHGLLLSHEHLLQGQSTTAALPLADSPAAFATRSSFSGLPRSNNRPNQYCHAPRLNYTPRPPQQLSFGPQPSPNGGNNSIRPSYQVRSSYQAGPRPLKPQCQICLKIGHTAKVCYYHISEDREATTTAQPPSTYHAYLTQPTEQFDEGAERILDSRATNHITTHQPFVFLCL